MKRNTKIPVSSTVIDRHNLYYYNLTRAVAVSGGARGARTPPFWKSQKCKRGSPLYKIPKMKKGTPFLKSQKCKRTPPTENVWYYPFPTEIAPAFGGHAKILLSPPPLNRVGVCRPRKNSATTPPPPTESRRLPEITENFCYYPPPH